MLDQTTKRKLDSARQILVGKVPDPKAQVEQITTALIYKFMDDMDKENEDVGLKTQFFVDENFGQQTFRTRPPRSLCPSNYEYAKKSAYSAIVPKYFQRRFFAIQ